ncbi:GIY-YIG nuclease family protein [Thermosynechococcaceae cyanobacterium BACA0444]|uniref:GIY-YIG nuclease family protein n=1 Tax=Pseudocalidococcus azoricus BACA0444 TaxID=2918990 RepID=A0AAE4FRS2_9CYAN|nr:GIY-YIG nuclease family protein [Pseudocalidococcus azoricus]MDS3859716.1 GIY-YIG nuclease family protein [Pseudocalidococcus azoricus BACA0444]
MTRDSEPPKYAVGEQAQLFSRQQLREAAATYTVQPGLGLFPSQLLAWQQKIYDYQQSEATQSPSAQLSLFALEPANLEQPENQTNLPTRESTTDQPLTQILNPFTLPQQNTEFWRWQANTSGQPALYFVIDYQWPILLYVGETLDDQSRWRGEHGCKRYLQNYVTALRTVNLQVSVGIGFWPGAAADRKLRQQQERELIFHWRSPFNKENWQYWQTPFVES